MVHCDSSTAATSRSLDGVRLNRNALSDVTQPERAVVFLERRRLTLLVRQSEERRSKVETLAVPGARRVDNDLIEG